MIPYDTSIRDSAIKERRERLEQERCRLLDVVKKTLMEIRDKYHIQEAYIVGSLLQPGRWDAFSDIDVAVSGCSKHSFSIMAELEKFTDKDIDVIELEKPHSADYLREKGMKIYG